jgi:hypothetical protein
MGCFQSRSINKNANNMPSSGASSHIIQHTASGSKEIIVEPGHLVFEVCISSITTRNIEAVDILNSDPFVRFIWGKTCAHETQHFSKSAVECRYPEKFAFYYSSMLSKLAEQHLKVEVYDWNRSGKHQLIGSTDISLNQIATGPVHHDHQLVSTHRSNPSRCGRVSFNCTMQSTDVWKMTVSGYRVIYKEAVLEEANGKPFRVRYNFVNNESKVEESLESQIDEIPRKAFGKLKVLTFRGSSLPPIRWTGSFLKFISGSLQIQLVCIQPTGMSYHGHSIHVQNMEQEFGQIWLPLKKLYATSTLCPQKKIIFNRGISTLSSVNSIDGDVVDTQPSLSSKSAYDSHNSNRSLATNGYVEQYIRREAEFDSYLWLLGQKVGSISGHIVFERVPPIGQMASGVLTENGIAAASPVVVGEAVGGTIFHFLKTKGHEKLPKKMKMLGHVFSKLITMNIAKANKQKSELKQRGKMKELFSILQQSDKFSMISFTYSTKNSLLNSQKLLLTIGNWFMDRIEANETSYRTVHAAYVGVVLILGRGEIGDLSTLGFDPLAGLNFEESHNDFKNLKADQALDLHGPTKNQIDIAILIRRFLIRCLVRAVERVRYQTKDTKERRFCATIFAICSFRLPTFGECMARAILPKNEVDSEISGWANEDINLNRLSMRCATQYDEIKMKNVHCNDGGQSMNSGTVNRNGEGGGQQNLSNSFESKLSKFSHLRSPSKVHGATMTHDPATMMMDWRYFDRLLSHKCKDEYKRQNDLLPRSCFDPIYVDEITDEALIREYSNMDENETKTNGIVERNNTKRGKGEIVRNAKQGSKLKLKSNSLLKGLRAAPVNVHLNLADFNNDMEAYRKAVNLQLVLIRDQSWILRLRKRQHFFLLVSQVCTLYCLFTFMALLFHKLINHLKHHRFYYILFNSQAWVQEVLDVVALVQRIIQWYEIPWYRELLKAIMLEFQTLEAARYPESLVLLSRALVSNPDVISPLIYVVTKTTRSQDLAGVSISLALIRSWFVAITSWDTRLARGIFPLGSLNRTSLPIDFQYDYLSSVIVCLFDDSLPFQITQKALEFLYSIWDIIPGARAEALCKTLLETGIFLNLMLHWERHVRIFFAYIMAVRFLQPRKWCGNGGMPSIHFEDFVEAAGEDEMESGETEYGDGDDDYEDDDIISIERMNSSSSRLNVDGKQKHNDNVSSIDGSPELKALPRTTHAKSENFVGAADVIGQGGIHEKNSEFFEISLNPSWGSVANFNDHVETKQKEVDEILSPPRTPTAAGAQHPKGTRKIVFKSQQNSTLSSKVSTITAPTSPSRSIVQDKMGALIRCLRRQTIKYELERKNTNAKIRCLDAREAPRDMENKFKNPTLFIIWKDIQKDQLKDELEYGTETNEACWGNDNVGGLGTKLIHPGIGGESQQHLTITKEEDNKLLRKDFLWSNVALPPKEKLVYAKDALRLYTLASRRVHALQEKLAEESITVPELTFVALVADESGHGYKDATTTRKDEYVNIQEA